MKFTSCLSLVAIASVATADDTTGGNLRSSAASLERHLGGPNENGPCNGICNAFENACDNDCEGGGGNGKGCTKLCAAALSFECTCGSSTTTSSTTTAAPTCEESISVGVDASSWDVGDGQSNGEFTLLDFDGVQVGIRAQERFVGLIPAADTNVDSIGEYEVKTGPSPSPAPETPPGSSWSFDWHVDVSNAVDTNKRTLAAYLPGDLLFTVECVSGCATFGTYAPTPLSLFGFGGASDSLFQDSQNIGFGFWLWNSGITGFPGDGSYDQDEEGTYKCCLTLDGFCPVCMLAKASASATSTPATGIYT